MRAGEKEGFNTSAPFPHGYALGYLHPVDSGILSEDSAAAEDREDLATASGNPSSSFPWWLVLSLLAFCGVLGAIHHRVSHKLSGDSTNPFIPPEGAVGQPGQPFPRQDSLDEQKIDEKGALVPFSRLPGTVEAAATEDAETSVIADEAEASPSFTSDETETSLSVFADDAETPPADFEEESETSPSVIVKEPAIPETAAQTSRSLPSLDENTRTLPYDLLKGRQALSNIAESMKYRTPVVHEHEYFGEQKHITAAVALALSQGGSKQLVGSSFVLSQALDGAIQAPSNISGQVFTVRRITAFGPSSVYAIAEDLFSKPFTIRFHAFPPELGSYSPFDLWSELSREGQVLSRAYGDVPISTASERRGLFIPLFHATVEGLPSEETYGSKTVLNEVSVMEECMGSLVEVLPVVPVKRSDAHFVRAYIAHRLLLETLYLQEAGVSHNGLELHSFFVHASGTIYLGGFEAACEFGDVLPSTAQLNPHYAEPQLLKEFTNYQRGGAPVKPSEKSDLWSLGAILFEVFTGRPLHELELMSSEYDGMSVTHAAMELEESGVSSTWKELVIRLLEVDRRKRISAADIRSDFSSLF